MLFKKYFLLNLGKSLNESAVSVQLATKKDNWQEGCGDVVSVGGGGGDFDKGSRQSGHGEGGDYQMDDPAIDDPSDGGFYGGSRGILLKVFPNLIFF